MSISSIKVITDRVMNGKPLAIFDARRVDLKAEKGRLDAVFADTVECKRLIKTSNPYYICTVDKKMGEKEVINALKVARDKCKLGGRYV